MHLIFRLTFLDLSTRAWLDHGEPCVKEYPKSKHGRSETIFNAFTSSMLLMDGNEYDLKLQYPEPSS
jgi:hypothetical protein